MGTDPIEIFYFKIQSEVDKVDQWSEEVIKASLTLSTSIWKSRCELVH